MIKRNWIIRFSAIPLVLALGGSPIASAAPCCSANAAAPALISGDDQAQLMLSASNSTVIGDAPAEGIPVFRSSKNSERVQTLNLDGAILLSDRWQVGAAAPLVRHLVSQPGIDDTNTTIGDLKLNGAYEVLPEWSFSPWRPKGYLFTQLIVPMGRSIYQTDLPGAVDAIGRGFYTVAGGALLLKTWGSIDAYLMPEAHYSLTRTFTDPSTHEPLTVSPGFGASAAIGVGYSPGGGRLRLGARLQPMYGAAKEVISSAGKSWTSYQLSWDAALEAGYLVADNWSLTASFTDETLVGPAVNSALSRTFTVGLQHRWPR